MQKLLDAADGVVELLAKGPRSREELQRAKALLDEALAESDATPLTHLAEAAVEATEHLGQVCDLFPGSLREEGGKEIAIAEDGSRWIKGEPDEPGTYWFVVPYVRKFKCADVFRGFYKQFPFERSVKLENYGSVTFEELKDMWHMPLAVPEAPAFVDHSADARGLLSRAMEGWQVIEFREGTPAEPDNG